MAAPDPTEVVRKLRQHDNEFESVYDLLRVIDGKIDTLDTKVDAGFERLDARSERLEAGFERLDARSERLEAGFERLDAGFERLDARSERLESGQQQILDLLRGRQQGDTTTE